MKFAAAGMELFTPPQWLNTVYTPAMDEYSFLLSSKVQAPWLISFWPIFQDLLLADASWAYQFRRDPPRQNIFLVCVPCQSDMTFPAEKS